MALCCVARRAKPRPCEVAADGALQPRRSEARAPCLGCEEGAVRDESPRLALDVRGTDRSAGLQHSRTPRALPAPDSAGQKKTNYGIPYEYACM